MPASARDTLRLPLVALGARAHHGRARTPRPRRPNRDRLVSATVAFGLVAGLAAFTSAVPRQSVPEKTAATAPAVDQAQWLTRAQAVAAYRVLQGQTEVMRLCQPCGERTPVREAITRPVVSYVPDETGDGGHYEIVLLPGGDAVDLAYVYVRAGARWTNLARHIGMDVVRVTTILL